MITPKFLIIIPTPNIQDGEEALAGISERFVSEGVLVSLRAEPNYPCSGSWALLQMSLDWAKEKTLEYFWDKVLDVFVAALLVGIKRLNLCIQIGGKDVYRDISLEDRDTAKKALNSAFFELSVGLNNDPSLIYWLDRPEIHAGDYWIPTSQWQKTGHFTSAHKVLEGTEDHRFFAWLLVVKRLARPILEGELKALRKEFDAKA